MDPSPGKNVVICLDGTGNQFKEENTNVVKLFRILHRSPDSQVAYYDPGVGTLADPAFKIPISKKISKVIGLAFGVGLLTNLVEAYTFLMNTWKPGDNIFIFGFSRGAYTARALSGFIHSFGILDQGCQNLIPYALKIFKAKPINFPILHRFKHTYGRPCNIHFLGLWDSVKTFGWIYNPVFLPYTTNNPSVQTIRHALAIDEKRSFFRPMHWGRKYQSKQDIKEVWFSGVHSDVGGGYPESESGLAKLSLDWMIKEACNVAPGLRIIPSRYERYILGRCNDGRYISPNAVSESHESLKWTWKLVQHLPQSYWRTKAQKTAVGMPKQTRIVSKADCIHSSVFERLKTLAYRPGNLNLEQARPYPDVETIKKWFIVEYTPDRLYGNTADNVCQEEDLLDG